MLQNTVFFPAKALYGVRKGNTVSIFECGDMNHLEHQELQFTGARLVISLQSWKFFVGQQYWEAWNIFFSVFYNPDIIIVLWAFCCLSLGVCFLFISHHLGYASQSSMNFICDRTFFSPFGLILNLWTDQFNFAATEEKKIHGAGQRPF